MLAFGQDEEATVIDDQAEAAGVLARGPTEPLLTGREMQSRGAEREPGDPLAVEFGDVTERLPGQAGAGQVVTIFPELIEGRAFLVADEARGDTRQKVGFGTGRWLGRGHSIAAGAMEVPSFLTLPQPCPHAPRSDEIALGGAFGGDALALDEQDGLIGLIRFIAVLRAVAFDEHAGRIMREAEAEAR